MSYDLFEQGVLLDVDVKIWDPTRLVKQDIVREEFETHKEYLRNSKYLIERKHLEIFNPIRTKLNRLTDNITIPFPMTGIKVVPKRKVDEFVSAFERIEEEFNEATLQFVNYIYPRAKDEARMALGALFDEADYPGDISKNFGVSYRMFMLSPIGQSSLIDPELIVKANNNFNDQMEKASAQVTSYLRTRFCELVTHLCERLSNGKTFKNTTVENLHGFLNNFKDLNITNDTELSALIEQTKELLQGTSPERIRKSIGIQSHIENGLKQVAQAIDSMLVNRTRQLIL